MTAPASATSSSVGGGDVFLVSAVRTPHGRYGGSLRDVRLVELGGIAGAAALARAGISGDLIGETVVSNCRQAGNGPNPGRQISLASGVPQSVPAQTVNMACASGLKAIQLAAQSIVLGDADVTLAVAAESMSTMPYLAPYTLRWGGVRRGDITVADGWKDGGTDPICGMTMGETAEKISREYAVDRAAQDAWALRSHTRLGRAWEQGLFDEQVVPVESDDGTLKMDETHRPDSTPEKLASLKPSFEKGGTVTAGNSSQMADGAAAVVLAGRAALERHGLAPRARLVSFASVGVDPTVMGIGPTKAIPLALERAGLSVGGHRPVRDQRGLRLADRPERPRPRPRRGEGQRQRWRHRAGPPHRPERQPPGRQPAARARADRRTLRHRLAVRRWRTGHRRGDRAGGRMSLAGMTVAVAGLGPMGRGIARVLDRAGATVLVVDVSAEVTAQGLDRIRAEAEKDNETLTSVSPASLAEAAAAADLLIEAIVEDMAAKESLLAVCREHGGPDLVVASNTSSLSIGAMGKAFGDPGRVVGLHFFNPPTKMRLVEVIRGAAHLRRRRTPWRSRWSTRSARPR